MAATPLDVDAFKAGLERLPRNFHFGSVEKGAMSRPFDEIVDDVPAPTGGSRRNPKTVNRDLSFMPTIAIKDKGDDPPPPWTRARIELLFGSPLYVGGGPLARCNG